MKQKIDHLKLGDLICVQLGFSRVIHPAIFIKGSDVSITYLNLFYNNTEKFFIEHIRTRHSTTQRIFKITKDNLDAETLSKYKKIRPSIIKEYKYLLPEKEIKPKKIKTKKLSIRNDDDILRNLI